MSAVEAQRLAELAEASENALRSLLESLDDEENPLPLIKMAGAGIAALDDLAGALAELVRLVGERERLETNALLARSELDWLIGYLSETDEHAAEKARRARAALAGDALPECNHQWLDLPTLDINPPVYSRRCDLCGLAQSHRGEGWPPGAVPQPPAPEDLADEIAADVDHSERPSLSDRMERVEKAVSTMAWWLVQAQTGFGVQDARGVDDILAGGAAVGGGATTDA